MDRAQIQDALTEFLGDEALQTAALSGDWGVGKTYLWRQYAASVSTCQDINGFSYASLFGITSLREVRAKITEGLVLRKGRKEVLEAYKGAAATSLVPRELPTKGFGTLVRFLNGGWSALVSEAGYWFVRDCVVCLDDIERAGQYLDISTVLGVVEELRQRNCKVLLILNRRQVRKEHKELLDQYWEKAVDIDLSLQPSVEENASIIFDHDFEPAKYAQWAKEVFHQLRSNNIRIHKRTIWLIRRVSPMLEELRESLQREVVGHAAVVSWALLSPEVEISTDMIQSQTYTSKYLSVIRDSGRETELTEAEQVWSLAVNRTQFSYCPYDDYLVSLIKTGWCDITHLLDCLTKINGEEAQQNASMRVHEMYRKLRESFTLGQSEFVGSLRNILNEELHQLDVFTFDTALQTLAKVGGVDPDELARRYVEARGDHLQRVAEAPNRDREPQYSILNDEVMRRQKAYQERRYSIDAVAERMANDDSWGPSQIEFLAGRSPEDFRDWLLSDATALGSKIAAILRFRSGNPTFRMSYKDKSEEAMYRRAVSNLEGGLRLIATRSDFDADRIAQAYGVTLK